eukprot:c25476_g2_i1 orf=164-2608(+)
MCKVNPWMADQIETDGQVCQASILSQTTEEVARAVVAAAAAVRPRPSIVFSSNQDHGNKTFRKLQRQWTRIWGQGSYPLDGCKKAFFNPEQLTSQKRQWNQLQLQILERKQLKEPVCLFEHMVLVGLHPKTDLEATKAALVRTRALERDLDGSERLRDVMRQQYRSSSSPKLEPQILFTFPPGKRLPIRQKDLPSFCFPAGLEAQLVERTPSLSELNEVVFGQDYVKRDDLSYLFLIKVADNATLYGVCVYVPEIIHNTPAIMAMNTDMQPSHPPLCRFLVSAYRCYCILTKLPFFDLHFEVLNSIIMQERLYRITKCADELTTITYDTATMEHVESNGVFPPINGGSCVSVESCAHDCTNEVSLANGGLYSFSSQRLESGLATSDGVKTDDFDYQTGVRDKTRIQQILESNERVGLEELCANENSNNKIIRTEDRNAEDLGFNAGTISPLLSTEHQRVESVDSINSVFDGLSRSSMSEEDMEEASSSGQENMHELEDIISWAEANNNYPLQIVCAYHKLPIPSRGSSISFQPLEGLELVMFNRLDVSSTLLGGRTLDLKSCRTNLEFAEAQAALVAAEEALAMSVFTVATLCRVLSLENILAMFAGALLEKQMVVICSNLGVLSAVVLSMIPLIRPFQWQCLMLPVLPNKMLDFLDAPVPFIVGIQNKKSAARSKPLNVVMVNVQKNKVTSPYTPQLPRFKELASALESYHSKLVAETEFARRHPVYEYNNAQAHAAEGFLAVLRSYLESLCTNLRSHTITNVQSNNDKVSLLLKESFVEDFSSHDRPFMKLFVDTQLFSVHSDTVLSFLESE